MAKPKKTKAQSQKTVSKAAKDLGFKNIKEAKDFLKTPDTSCGASQTDSVGFTEYREINEEIAQLMKDPHATDEYIVERTRYLISKYKSRKNFCGPENSCDATSACCAPHAPHAPQTPKEVEGQILKFFLFPKTRYYNLFDNFTVTASI